MLVIFANATKINCKWKTGLQYFVANTVMMEEYTCSKIIFQFKSWDTCFLWTLTPKDHLHFHTIWHELGWGFPTTVGTQFFLLIIYKHNHSDTILTGTARVENEQSYISGHFNWAHVFQNLLDVQTVAYRQGCPFRRSSLQLFFFYNIHSWVGKKFIIDILILISKTRSMLSWV